MHRSGWWSGIVLLCSPWKSIQRRRLMYVFLTPTTGVSCTWAPESSSIWMGSLLMKHETMHHFPMSWAIPLGFCGLGMADWTKVVCFVFTVGFSMFEVTGCPFSVTSSRFLTTSTTDSQCLWVLLAHRWHNGDSSCSHGWHNLGPDPSSPLTLAGDNSQEYKSSRCHRFCRFPHLSQVFDQWRHLWGQFSNRVTNWLLILSQHESCQSGHRCHTEQHLQSLVGI